MNFRKLSRRLLSLAFFNFCLISAAFAQNKTTPFQELAQKLAAAKSEVEQNALLEQNKQLQTIDLRKALLAEAFRLRVEGSYDKALATDNFAWQFAGRIDDKAGVAAAINNVGVDYQEIGQYKTAIEFFKQSLEHKTALKDQTGIASSSNNIGLSYIYIGEYKLAEQYLQKALKILEDANRKDVMMMPINNLGIIQRRLGNQARARAFYEQSLRLSEETKNKNGAAIALSNLAVLKIEEGDFPAALELNLKSLALREELGNKNGVSISLGNIGNVYLEQDDFKKALDYYEKKLKITEETKVLDSAALALTEIANVKLKMNQPAEALNFAERAAAIAEEIGSEEILWQIFKIRGAAYRQLNQPEKAKDSLDAAIKIIESRRLQLSPGAGGMQNYFSNKIEPYHEKIALLVEQRDFTGALDYAERAKARVLLDVLSSEPFEIGKLMSVAEKEREREINARISLLNQQTLRERARTPQPDAERLKRLERELEKTRLDYEAFRAEIYRAHPQLQAQRGEAKTIASFEIADLLLKEPNKVLLEYVVTSGATYLFVISKPKIRNAKSPIDISIHKIPISQKDLMAKTDDFRRSIAARGEYKTSARQLYNLLVAPARQQLKEKTQIVVVPDAALWNLPFQALLTEQNRFLLEDYVLSYAPSLTALREMKKITLKRREKSEKEKTLLAFGNPSFETTNVEAQTSAAIRRGSESLQPLPDAEKEVNSIAALYGARRSQIYVKSEAREDRAKTEFGSFKIVQFATHSVFNDVNPLYSYLVLSPNAASGDDGLLEARELMNLNLSADLVVLSACETARGRVSAGEGLTGMTWALFIAGVPTTVASQWKVPSAGTSEIMLDFHRNLLRKGSTDKAAALRQAELNYLRSGAFQHPFYWAGFVLVGSNQTK